MKKQVHRDVGDNKRRSTLLYTSDTTAFSLLTLSVITIN